MFYRASCFVCGRSFSSWNMCRKHERAQHTRELEAALAKVRQGYKELCADIAEEDKVNTPPKEPTS